MNKYEYEGKAIVRERKQKVGKKNYQQKYIIKFLPANTTLKDGDEVNINITAKIPQGLKK